MYYIFVVYNEVNGLNHYQLLQYIVNFIPMDKGCGC